MVEMVMIEDVGVVQDVVVGVVEGMEGIPEEDRT